MIHIVLGYKSRYDQANGKFCGPAAELLYSLIGTDFTTSYLGEPVPESAKLIALAGRAAWATQGRAERDVGVVFPGAAAGTYIVCTWHPQDAADVIDVESALHESDDDEFAIDDAQSKNAAPTQRINYRFWLKVHLNKLINRSWEHDTFNFMQYPLHSLRLPVQSKYLYLDIETHPASDTLQCLSIAFDNSPVYSQIVYNYDGTLRAGAVESMVWLARAMRMHTVVIHNALFDLPFLAMMHSIPWGYSVHDTMAMFHRLYPEADKSLAHLIQYFTNERYHKDEAGTFNPHNAKQQEKLLAYNARDVYALRLVHRGLMKHYSPSMQQVNESILDYAFVGLHGFYLDYKRRQAHLTELEKRVEQLKRIFRILVGNADANPNSGQQLAAWLYSIQPNGLGYRITDRTDSGEPSTNATAIYKALAEHEKNVALIVLLQIKELAKKISMLNFEPYVQSKKR